MAARLPRVIVTRPAAQAGAAVRQLEARGIEAVALPLIEIAGVADSAAVADAWAGIASRRLVVFVSVNAVSHFFAARPAALEWPAQVVAAAPGPATASALEAAGVDANAIVEPAADAAQLDSEALWARLAQEDWRGASVLVVRGDGGREWLGDRLAGAGAIVEAVAVYSRRAPVFDAAAQTIVDAVSADPQGHAWLFSSSQAIGNLEALATAGRWNAAAAIATHPRIAQRARQAGFADVREARPAVDDVVACIQSMRP